MAISATMFCNTRQRGSRPKPDVRARGRIGRSRCRPRPSSSWWPSLASRPSPAAPLQPPLSSRPSPATLLQPPLSSRAILVPWGSLAGLAACLMRGGYGLRGEEGSRGLLLCNGKRSSTPRAPREEGPALRRECRSGPRVWSNAS
jgi:hypothetical protein